MADAKLEFLNGVDLRPYAVAATEIKNMRYDDGRLCWLNDRSYTDWLNPDDDTTDPVGDPNPIISVYSHQFHKTGKHVLLYEAQGTTTAALHGYQGPTLYSSIDTGRPLLSPDNVGTQYVPIGRFLFVIRDGATPLLVNDLGQSRKAFFHGVPAPPTPMPGWGSHKGNFGDQSLGTQAHTKKVGAGGLAILDARGNLGMAPSPERIDIAVGQSSQQVSVATRNCFQYAVSFITDTGAESPLSPLSNQVTFSYEGGVNKSATNQDYKHGVALSSIPNGPEGTVKRRLYRTKNQRLGGAQSNMGVDVGDSRLYFLVDIPDNVSTNYLDLVPDSGLGSLAPDFTASGVFPVGVSVAAAFKSRLIVSGIAEENTVLYYSRAGFPEQFPSLNFLNVGSEGGAITALHSSDNLCYIFRERGIDMLVPTENLDFPFKIVPLTRSVGSLSPNSVVDVPGVGVVFLGADRVFYALSKQGNFDGGSGLTALGASIEVETKKISRNALAQVHAVYSSRDKEYWATCPMNGDRYATQGFVYHTPIKGWSYRKNIPAGCFTYIPENWVVFGSNSTQSNLPVIGGTSKGAFNNGVMVWCGAAGEGYTSTGSGEQERRDATTGVAPFTYETTWLSLGEPNALKSLRGVTLYCYKNVSGAGDMRVGVDWKPLVYGNPETELDATFQTYNSERPTAAVYGTGKWNGGFKGETVSTIDANRWSGDEILQVRVSNPYLGYEVKSDSTNITAAPSVDSATQLGSGGARWFKMRFSGTNPVDLIGFTVHYELNGDIKQLSFAAGKNDTRDAELRTILGMS